MDFTGGLVITNILSPEELEQTPTTVQEKLNKYLEKFFDEYCKNKAAANRLVDYEQKVEDLQALLDDYELKIENLRENVSELRSQLDVVSNERLKLQESLNSHEKEICQLRSEKKSLTDERDDILKMLERQNNAVERIQEDLKVSQQQLKIAIAAKCEALTRNDDIESRELNLEFKERRMDQEREMLQKQIQTLTEDLNRTINDLQDARRENRVQSLHFDTRLMEKTEEVKIVENQCTQYKETIEELTQKTQELTATILSQKEQTQKIMDHYKKELDAKAKLADLYKNNCEDSEMQSKELMSALNDMKRMLAEASAQYGELETSSKAAQLNHEKEIEEKDKLIESLKAELAHANDLLKEVQQESLESAISKLAPTAAISSRLIRADMSLTELYSLYVKTSEEVELQKRENGRLNLQLKKILSELNESAPGLKKQEIEYEKLLETNNILTLQLDEMISKKADMQELLVEAHAKINYMDRENRKLKQSQTDLSRQVCLLLKEVEQLRIGLLSDSTYGAGDANNSVQTTGTNVITTNEVISKKLVTFNSITELQENNQKLLLLVRELSSKVEEAEAFKQEMDEACYQEKLEQYTKKVENMQETLNQQNSTVATLLNKCERYKKLYFELQKTIRNSSNGNNNTSNNKYNGMRHRNDETDYISDIDEEEGEEGDEEEDTIMADNDERETNVENCKSSSNKNKNISNLIKDNERRIGDLEQQLDDAKDQYKTLKEQYDYYIQEKKNNEKILNEQFEALRAQVRELKSSNSKMSSSLEYAKGQVNLQQRNAATHKQQIAALEERSKNYENTIIKHEQTILYLKDETMKATRSASAAESEIEQLRHENNVLKDTIARFQSEKDIYHRNQQNQNMMLNNLELIKLNMERWETEGRTRMEQRLDDTVRELAAQRRHFQEEEERLRESINDLNRQTETAKKLLEEEKFQSNKMGAEMEDLRQQLLTKTQQVDELSRKLQESLTPSKNDNPIALANKKARDFEVKYETAQIEIESLKNELKKVREHSEQYYKMSQSAEMEINNLHDMHTKVQAELKQLRDREFNMATRISELETELQLQTVVDLPIDDKPDELGKAKDDVKDALQKLSECNRTLRSLREENVQLSETLSQVETKYANEMVAHSNDIKELTKVKGDVVQLQGQIKDITAERDGAKMALEELRRSQNDSLNALVKEKEELENRVKCLDLISTVFHDQVEDLTNRLMLLSQGPSAQVLSSDSKLMDTSDTIEGGEPDCKNSDQLLQIIKYLRKEKDLTIAKLDIVKAENSRLQAELTILRKRNDELQDYLNREQAKTTTNVVSVSKHEQILRKVETLNAVTDSNRVLREERNSLAERVKELNVRISTLEDEIIPLQNANHELKSKIDDLTSENTSLRTEAMKWRQRANVLVEKSNKNPEEFKRLQSERENLAKMLTAEKEQIKHLLDELNANKADKARIEAELATLQEEKKSCQSDLNVMKQTNSRLMQEVMELKSKLLYKEEHIQNSIDELAAKDKQLVDMKSKEAQIRKIAKRYKDLYTGAMSKAFRSRDQGDDLASSIANAAAAIAVAGHDNADLMVNVAGTLTQAEGSTELELRNSIDNLNTVIRSLQDENDKIRKDYDDLKTTLEGDERTKVQLLDARTHIATLTESRDVVTHELTATKNKLLQNAEAHESALNEMKTQYEDTVSRLQRELNEHTNRNKEDMQRLQRENESLIIRINQLNRQLGLQQSAKPSTSSVTISDKGNISDSSPRTANVKPMSGSTSVQQSATVTPWRGSETPLASIRPISVQNTRTAAILPTSQQTSGSSVGVAGTSSSTSTSSTSTSSTSGSSSTAGSGSGGSSCNTALVPPQQQVHTTGSSSLETMSSSPTSSHTDFMPSTSTSVSVAVATIPPMGSTSAAESSQEAESLQQTQQNDTQATHVSGGTSSSTSTSSSQIQVVALVSPRVEGSLTTTCSSQTTTTSPNMQIIQDTGNQQPSTSGSGGCNSHVTVSSHSRHAPSSSNVTTTQAGSSAGHKRPREPPEGDSSTSAEDQDKHLLSKHPKRMRPPMHGVDISLLAAGVTDSGIDVDQVPTSSQRDQEDDVVVVDSEDDDDGMAEAEADDGPTDGDADHEVYEDSYDQDQDMDENDCPEINESNMRADVSETDNNEADVNEGSENQAQCTSAGTVIQLDTDAYNALGASTSAAAAALSKAHSQQDNNQQSQAISSGSGESSNWKQSTTTTTTTLTRQQKATLMMLQQGVQQGEPNDTTESTTPNRRIDNVDLVSSPQDSKCGQTSDTTSGNSVQQSSDLNKLELESQTICSKENSVQIIEKEFLNSDEVNTNKNANTSGTSGMTTSEENKNPTANEEIVIEADEDFNDEDTAISEELPGNTSNATQSELQDIQQSQMETTSEDNEGADGVSSEGEKQAVEEIEEEGREAEATTSPSINTRSKSTKNMTAARRSRGFVRATNRPTPILWRDSPGTSRNTVSVNQRNMSGGGTMTGTGNSMTIGANSQDQQNIFRNFTNQRGQRARRNRRPPGNFSNMRYN